MNVDVSPTRHATNQRGARHWSLTCHTSCLTRSNTAKFSSVLERISVDAMGHQMKQLPACLQEPCCNKNELSLSASHPHSAKRDTHRAEVTVPNSPLSVLRPQFLDLLTTAQCTSGFPTCLPRTLEGQTQTCVSENFTKPSTAR